MVHVWRFSIRSEQARKSFQLLSEEEREKAGRFYFEKDREQYQQSHTALRMVLGQYLAIAPERLVFCVNDYGKPYLTEPGGSGLCFNLSHSGGLALIAISKGLELGIDIERIRTDLVDPLVARRYFAPSETEKLFSLPTELRAGAFFNCWTRKEAYVKGRGMGLSLPLDAFEVTLEPGCDEVILTSASHPEETAAWQIHPLQPGDGYVAALAVRARNWRLRCFQWQKQENSL